MVAAAKRGVLCHGNGIGWWLRPKEVCRVTGMGLDGGCGLKRCAVSRAEVPGSSEPSAQSQ
jgi:hypothetical protein